ncbi:MAG TPA: TolC family outer membrane protein [Burkholderiaceae bacterium]|nr:TolC family outer membrane protein [Burkholderiaceae bacterium]
MPPSPLAALARPSRRRPFAPLLGLVVAALLGLGARAAHAQSLQELYDAAHGYDAAYLSARSNLDAAQLRYDQARGLRLPQVGLGAQVGRQISNTPDSPSTQAAAGNSASATLNASQTLFNRSNDVTIRQAERAVDVYRADLDAVEQDLILRVSQAYFDVLAAQDNLATARASLAAISEQVASAKRNFEVGTATITDTREAQARYDLARFTQIQAENDLTTKRILLDQTVGRANIVPKQLAAPLALPPLAPANVDDWVARADAEHPTIRRARTALELARLDTAKAKAANLPTVTLNGSYGRGRSDNQLVVPGQSFGYSTPTTQSSISVNLNVPLFAGYQIQNRVKETLVLEDKSQSDLDAARRGVIQLTRQLYYQVGSAGAQVGALEAAESSSKLALEATQLGFKVGVRVNIDVLNAQAQLYTTQAQLAKARYDLIMAGMRLRQASGRLSVDDVNSVNGLLVR